MNENVVPADKNKEELLVFQDLAEPKGGNVRIAREPTLINAYAISTPTGNRNVDESRSFRVGFGICLEFSCMLCLSSAVKFKGWTQN